MTHKNARPFGMWDSIQFLRKYLIKYKTSFIMFFLGWFLQGVLQVVLPLLFGILIDEMVYYKDVDTFMKISLLIFVLTVFLSILYFMIYAFHNHITNRYAFDIKIDLFSHLLSLETHNVEDAKAGDLINTLKSYTTQCVYLVTRNIIYNVYQAIFISFFVACIFMIHIQLGLLVMAFAPLSVYLTLKSGKKIRKFSDRERVAYGDYVGWLFEMLNRIKDIRLLNAEKRVQRTFATKHKELFYLSVRKKFFSLNLMNGVEFLNLCLQLTLFGVGAYLTIQGKMTIGLLTVVFIFFKEIKEAIIAVNGYYVDLQDRLSAVKYIKDFKELTVEPNEEKPDLKVTDGVIVFDHMDFTHKGRKEIFKGLTLNINAGERVALVGKSGSGKTTLVNMIVGFLIPEEGRVLIDGQDLAQVSLNSIRQKVGIVQQNVLIFDGTIRENIQLGNLKATEEQLIMACEKTGIAKMISKLPNGLDTVIGSNGMNLSGGQKQLIAITRVYLKDPAIILLDEATSALDKDTEHIVHEAWDDIFQNKTVIVISHKISSIMHCSRTVLLEEGRIVEDGETHQLLHGSRRFQDLFSLDSAV